MQIRLTNPNITQNYVRELLTFYGVEDVDVYLHPNITALLNPRCLENIERGAQLYKDICDANGKILLIVDSDVDGFTSSSIFYMYTKLLYPHLQIDYRLHDSKQHGLEDHIDWIEDNPYYDLIVCPDSSSNDFDYHERLKILGIPVLILDHHITDVPISENAIVINNQLSPNYPNKDNTGAGIVYQFCRYLDEKYNVDYAKRFIDLAALGIDGDMGSLLSLENRYIMLEGFSNIQNFFFKTLVDKQSYSMGGKITPISVAFYIVPMINAMIRVGTMAEKNRLFEAFIDGTQMVKSNKRGANGAEELLAVESARECTNAKNHQNKDKEAIVAQLEQKIQTYNLLDNKILFIRLDEEDFPPALNGLVAMQLAAKYKRPTVIARLNSEGYDRGSIRGVDKSGLASFKDFLTDSGLCEYVQGHDNAAGISIDDRNLQALHEYANNALKDVDFNEKYLDAQFERNAYDIDLVDIIYDIAAHPDVWGTKVPEPMIYVKNIRIKPSDIQIMGKNQDTLKFVYNNISYICFHAKEKIQELSQFSKENGINSYLHIEVIGRGNLNEWMGNITAQCIITEWELKNDILQF